MDSIKALKILITADVDTSQLDTATEKASRLKALLVEVKELADSLGTGTKGY